MEEAASPRPFLAELREKAVGDSRVVEDTIEQGKSKRVSVEEALLAVYDSLRKRKEVTQYLSSVRIEGACPSVVQVLENVLQIVKDAEAALSVELKPESNVGRVIEEDNTMSPDSAKKRNAEATENWYIPSSWKSNIEEIRDTIQFGSKIAVALPKERDRWNGKALLLAHGFRTEGTGLIADLSIEETFLKRLLKAGWLVGMTSYRRDGRIVKEAIDDVNFLRDYIVAKVGEPSLCLLEGRSMGGAIVTLISERYPERYQGIVAIGAALLVKEKENPIDFLHKPLIPLLFLTNQSELGPIQEYIAECNKANEKEKDERFVPPALWEVWREGHNTVSQEERYAALQSVLNWVEHKTFITARKMNIFVAKPPKGPRAELVKDCAKAVVLNVHPVFKSFSVNLLEEDMEKLGIRKHRYFYLKVEASSTKEEVQQKGEKEKANKEAKQLKVFYGSYPFLVDKGTWISFDHPDGYLCFDIFGWYDCYDAAAEAGVTQGSTVAISSHSLI